MIVREHDSNYMMIEQDDHARISGELAENWKDSLFAGQVRRKSVEYAISNHDFGWKPMDKQPFWNDAKNKPYTFTDFPVPAKAVLYKQGIDEVARWDLYAALLCSRHYSRFLQNQKLSEAKKFVDDEDARQQQIMESIGTFDQVNYDFHYAMLQFCDNVSLYVCLNDPGVAKQNEHLFFQSGIPVPAAFSFFHAKKTRIRWKDKQTVAMEMFPFTQPINLNLKQKLVKKEAISSKGLLESYQEAPMEEQHIRLVPMK